MSAAVIYIFINVLNVACGRMLLNVMKWMSFGSNQ